MFDKATAAPATTRSVEDEDKRRNPAQRVTSTTSEEAQGRGDRLDGKGIGAQGTAARRGIVWTANRKGAEMGAEMSAEISAR